MDVEDKDIWDSALTEEPEVEAPEVEETQPEEPEQPETIAVARDEHGRFAPKPEAEKPKAEEPERGPPAWRLKEEADARRSAEQRAAQLEQQLQQFMRQQEQKPPPDIFENPGAFVDQGVRTAVDPIKQEIGQLREFYSQREAIREHGQEKVKAAYDWIAQGMQSRDPERMAIYNRAMSSFDPYGEIVNSHIKQTVYEQIGNDPIAYAKKQALELAKADPEFQKELLGLTRSAVQQARPPAVQLPPSLSRVSGGLPRAAEDDDDNSDAGLFRQATR